MPQTMPQLVSETNALHKAFDAAADLACTMLTIFESDHASAVDNLHAWAEQRGLPVKYKAHAEGDHQYEVYRVECHNGCSISVHR